ncbi:MAG TPA: DUF4214 domain-containing protein [Acidobacteriota bacterium]
MRSTVLRLSGNTFFKIISRRLKETFFLSSWLLFLLSTSVSAGRVKTSVWSDSFYTLYSLLDGQTSPDGKWKCAFTGYGQVGTESLISGNLGMKLEPQVSTDPGTTHSSLVMSATTFSDALISLDVRTVLQLRLGSAPNPWEVAWLFFRASNWSNCYYFMVKPNGAELGKLVNGGQVFLATTSSPTLTVGNWNHWSIDAQGNRFVISVDGVQVIDYTDQYAAPSFSSGSVALYTEDAYVQFDNVSVATSTRSGHAASLDNGAFVAQQYQDFFNGYPQPADLNHWIKKINSGELTRERVVLELFKAAQLQSDSALIARLYSGILRRPAQYEEFVFWASMLDGSPESRERVVEKFISSVELQSRFGGNQSDAELVEALYWNIFSRAPNQRESSYWAAELNSGRITRARMALQLIDAPEYVRSTDDTIFVQMSYFSVLRREANPEELSYWVDQLNLGGSHLGLLAALIDSPEYSRRFEEE